jgi:hypothetical protein
MSIWPVIQTTCALILLGFFLLLIRDHGAQALERLEFWIYGLGLIGFTISICGMLVWSAGRDSHATLSAPGKRDPAR